MHSSDWTNATLPEGLGEVCLALVRALSLEELLGLLCLAATEHLGLDSAAVYLPRRGSYCRLACEPSGAPLPEIVPVGESELKRLRSSQVLTGSPWYPVAAVEVSVVPLPGRRRPAGFLLGEGSLSAPPEVVSLLVGLVAALLENHEVEVRRTQSVELQRQRRGDLSDLGLLGESPAMRQVAELVRRVAAVDSSVLLTGETGTGKTLVAQTIHRASPRAKRPFLAVNCSAIPATLIESELFGHEAGAFTGAQGAHRGKVEQAAGGTLFLDEVIELPPAAQAKLLTFLESRRFSRVGGETEQQADVRILSATNADLDAALQAGRLREDLYYRLNVFTLEMPPLRARARDVISMAQAFAEEVATRYGYPPPHLSLAVEERLLAYRWPGNVRELRNVLEKAVILSEGGVLSAQVLPGGSALAHPAGPTPPELPSAETLELGAEPLGETFALGKRRVVEEWERSYVVALLNHTGGNVAAACRLSQLDKRNLQRKIQRYEIDLDAIRTDGTGC